MAAWIQVNLTGRTPPISIALSPKSGSNFGFPSLKTRFNNSESFKARVRCQCLISEHRPAQKSAHRSQILKIPARWDCLFRWLSSTVEPVGLLRESNSVCEWSALREAKTLGRGKLWHLIWTATSALGINPSLHQNMPKCCKLLIFPFLSPSNSTWGMEEQQERPMKKETRF